MRSSFRVVVLFLLAAGVGVLAAEDAPGPEVTPEVDSASSAAAAGVEWLVGPGQGGSAGTNLANLNKLYRAVADEAVAERLLVELRKLDGGVGRIEIPTELAGRRYLLWQAVDPLVKQVVRDRCAGEEKPEGADRLAAHVQEHQADLVGRLPLSRRIVAAYYLEQAGLDCCDLYEGSLSALRAALEAFPADKSLAHDPLLLYAVTHVLFTRSGYYDRYLDPEDFQPELAAIRSAAASIAEGGVQPMDTDVAAELLVALKLLRVPPDGTVEAIRRDLVAMQNEDGSWNGMRGPSRHTSLVCTLALADFAPTLRGNGNIRCAP